MDSILSGINFATSIANVAYSTAVANSSLPSSTLCFICSNSFVKPSILSWFYAANSPTDSLAAYMTLSMADFASSAIFFAASPSANDLSIFAYASD